MTVKNRFGLNLPPSADECCPQLNHLLTGDDEYVKREDMVRLAYVLLRLNAREPVDEALGNLF